ncbi:MULTISPECIES: restriction endonuclease subunit S [Burkholderia]|uniref:restriction endonuclease subunit S n=1 Tax=Burkholderia TaxID=32008 RepID=UPI0009BDB439|nr:MULTISPECIES: restriction endonuclease subunit S [Burkholderia]QMI43972.1 restriction endonuclease subunit S [Burkholderia sp. MBR-1]HDV8353881.1 restriction endonuclease subunit S [Burkholderia vietnamiensis]
MELKPGYKQTEVGVIPEDWDVVTFKEQFSISAGGDVNQKLSSSYQDEAHCFPIYSNSLTDAGLYGYCSYADHPAKSITVTARGTLGVATYRGQKYTAIGRVLVLEPKRECVGSFFAEYINGQVEFAIESTGVPQLTAPQIGGYLIVVPPLPEQSAIAEALSDVDDLLSGLDKLIAKKRDLKQAAMQQLLTGKTRLPGFGGEWVMKRLDELGVWKGGMTPSMQNPIYWENGDVPWISSGDVKTVLLDKTGFSITSAAISHGATTLLPEKSIIVVARSGILRKYLPVAMNVVPMAINQDIKALMPSCGFCASFLLHSLIGSGRRILATCLKAGTTVESIEFRWLKAFMIAVPPTIEEQTAIAEVLSDMDAELAALEARRDKTHLLKQGMMHELLTGKTRLV